MPPGEIFEILIATGAFLINLDHPATYFILVIVNVT